MDKKRGGREVRSEFVPDLPKEGYRDSRKQRQEGQEERSRVVTNVIQDTHS